MRTVFSNSEIPHLWASGKVANARNSGESYHFSEGTICSYAEPIATLVKIGDKTIALFRNRTFSVTTSRHQSRARQAVNHLERFTVKNIGMRYTRDIDHRENLADYAERIEQAAKAARRARGHADWKFKSLAALVDEANRYSAAFKLRKRFTAPTDEELEARAAKAKRDAAIQARKAALAAKQRAERERADAEAVPAQLAAWEAGTGKWPAYGDLQNARVLNLVTITGDKLRVMGDEVQTSRGTSVPLAHVTRILPAVLRIIDRGQAWTSPPEKSIHIGHYTLDRVTEAGEVYVGCHLFTADEVRRFAATVAG